MAGPNYGNGGTFDYGNVLRNVNEMQNRNALTQNRLDPNSIDNRLRAAQIEKLEREAANPGGGGRVSPVSFKDATAESLAEYQRSGDASVLERHYTPYKPWTADTKTHREFWDIDVNTREPMLIKSIPIENFNAARDSELGKASASEGGFPSYAGENMSVTAGQAPDDIVGGGNMPAMKPVPSKAGIEGEVAREKAKQTKIGAREGELVAGRTKADVMMAEAFGKNDMISGQLANARRLAGPLTVGWAGSKLSDLAGSEANDLRLELQSIRSNAGLDTIRDMKAAGGTVGQVTEAEWPKLESKYAALEQSGSLEEFNRRLTEFETQYKASLTRLQAAYKQDYGEAFNFKKFMAQGGADTGGGSNGTSGGGTIKEGTTATNPTTNKKIIFRNGAWQPMQ